MALHTYDDANMIVPQNVKIEISLDFLIFSFFVDFVDFSYLTYPVIHLFPYGLGADDFWYL
jgi:hypothetical protein